MPLRHAKVSTKPDGPDNTLVQPSDWNADHVIPGQTAGDLIVRTASGWDRLPVGNNGQVLTVASNAPSWQDAPSGGGVSDGDKGDITVSGNGANWTIDNNAVTYAKMQDVGAARLLGRRSGSSGDPEELTAASPLEVTSGSAVRIAPAPVNGYQLQTINGAADWAPDPFALLIEATFLPNPTTNWRSLWPFTGAGTTIALTAGRCYFILVPVYHTRSITALGFEVSAASAGSAEVAIYAPDGTSGRPGTRLAYVSGLNTGATGVQSSAVSVTLEPGLYWAALRSTAAATLRGAAGSFAFGISTGGNNRITHLFNADAALTDPVTSDPTSVGTGTLPHIYARWS